MLVTKNRRTQNHPSSSPNTQNFLPSPPHQQHQYSNSSYYNAISPSPSPSDISGKLLQHYFDSPANSASAPSVVIDTSNIPISSIDQYMPNAFDFQQNQAGAYPYTFPDSAENLPVWSSIGSGPVNGVANSIHLVNRGANSHNRAASSSSIGSTGSVSPYQSSLTTGRVRVPSQASGSRKPTNLSHSYRGSQSSVGNHLPTPTQTPTQDSFLVPANSNFHHQRQTLDSAVTATEAMNQALTAREEDLPSMSRSGRHSFSSVGQEPATPMTSGGYHEESLRANQNDSMVPKLDRTVTDAYSDELYYPQEIASSQTQAASTYLVPHGNPMINERLQAAQMARSSSSTSSQSRALSPFRPESPYVHAPIFSTAAQIRQQQKDRSDAQELSYQMSPHTDSNPKTISPQEAMLDYKPDEDEVPLFPETSDNYGSYSTTPRSSQQAHYIPSSTMGFGNLNASSGQDWNSGLSAPAQNYGNFIAPSMPANLNAISYLGNFGTHGTVPQAAKVTSRQSDRTPEFPAHLTSMESSASEAPASSADSTAKSLESEKPDSSANTGTYSCTYHGCAQRFATPQKLQKHKRDAHRGTPNITPGVGSGMSTAELMERNSQTGPHKCERTNPTTGKPCNTIFSRPYDLTRHEDTIHNIRKQKVRCALCQEEKTFSRSDALTRHMRVVHPDVDFPGKHRRRGGASD